MEGRLVKTLKLLKISDSELHYRNIDILRESCALVMIENGKVKEVLEPSVHYCPLVKTLHRQCGIDTCLNAETIAQKLRKRVSELGMFTQNRKIVYKRIAIPYGASEMLMYALQNKGIDAAVTVCDGAGSVITTKPEIVQGIGAYMGGLLYTTPRQKVINCLKERGCIVLRKIDQLEAVKTATKFYRKVAVTLLGMESDLIKQLQSMEREHGVEIITLVVCTTGINYKQATSLQKADLVWACGSRCVREVTGSAAKLQLSLKIPVFVLSSKGIDFLRNYAELPERVEGKCYVTRHPLVKGVKIRVGNFHAHLLRVSKLPVRTEGEPSPLT